MVITDANGLLSFTKLPAVGAYNGLTKTGADSAKLGGSLSEHTTINAGAFDFKVANQFGSQMTLGTANNIFHRTNQFNDQWATITQTTNQITFDVVNDAIGSSSSVYFRPDYTQFTNRVSMGYTNASFANQFDLVVGNRGAFVDGSLKLTGKLNLASSFTPTGSADTSGEVGDIARDDNYIYIKTSSGWKRAAFSTF